MRSDFSKVVTERPRYGGFRKHKDVRHKKDRTTYRADEDGDIPLKKSEGMRYPYGYNRKEFSDLLGPLYKFLHSRIGKPWSKVHSEICANLKGRSTQQQHILDHLKKMVTTDLYWDETDRILRNSNGTEFRPYYRWHHDFWVDPRDGHLKTITEKMRNKMRTERKAIEEANDELKTKDGAIFRRIDGIWYEVQEVRRTVPVTEAFFYGEYNRPGLDVVYIEQVETKKRQLGTAELKKMGLKNEYEE